MWIASTYSVMVFSEAIQDFKEGIVYKNYLVMSFPSEERILFFLYYKSLSLSGCLFDKEEVHVAYCSNKMMLLSSFV